MIILAIDPGNIESGWCFYDTKNKQVMECGKEDNNDIITIVEQGGYDLLAVEMIASYGMPVGATVFETCVWIGRFEQANSFPFIVTQKIYRKDVKMYLCGTPRAKDGNIRQAIIDLFPATGGGKTPQIGVKSNPGPLYGVSGDVWAAIGVALTAENSFESKN